MAIWTERLKGLAATLREPPALLALAFNSVPAVCVLLFDWSPAILLLLYWAENVAIGLFNVFKMLIVGARDGLWSLFGILFTTAFFIVHYGLFALAHGLFALTFLNMERGGADNEAALERLLLDLPRLLLTEERGFLMSLIAIVALQAVAFGQWLASGAWRDPAADEKLMSEPYARLVILHLGLFGMAYALMALNSPALGVFVLAVIKTVVEALWFGRKARRRSSPA